MLINYYFCHSAKLDNVGQAGRYILMPTKSGLISNTRRRLLGDEREQLFRRFDELGIEAPSVSYPSHRTVEEGKKLRGEMRGTFTKNLLLKGQERPALSDRSSRRPRVESQVLALAHRRVA